MIRPLLLLAAASLLPCCDRAGGNASAAAKGRWLLPVEERQGDPFPRTFLDQHGSEIVIPAPPERIASATVFTDAVLLDFCPRDRIAALSAKSKESEFSPVAKESQSFPNHITADPESILWVNPDLVFLSSFSDRSTLQLVGGGRRRVVRLHRFDTLAAIQNNIRAVGYLLGLDSSAEARVADMDAWLGRIQRKAKSRGAVWRVVSWSGGYVAGAGTIFDSLLPYCGASNLAAEKGTHGHTAVPAERILDWNPDALVVGVRLGGEEAVRKLIKQSAALRLLPAVQKDRIVFVPNALLLSTSHHLVGAAEVIARQLDRWGKP
ncbi:MAG: ABC transporter substrate-binding protein [Planctomycetota bacterium]